jgi:hypothetical protein
LGSEEDGIEEAEEEEEKKEGEEEEEGLLGSVGDASLVGDDMYRRPTRAKGKKQSPTTPAEEEPKAEEEGVCEGSLRERAPG